MQSQMKMLFECYEIMGQRFNQPKMAMNALVQWIAYMVSVDSYIDVATPTMTLQMFNDLHAAFDLDLLRSEPWDYLGDLAHYLGLYDWHGKPYLSKEETIKWVKQNVPTRCLQSGEIIFDPYAGSGRLCLALYNLGANCIMAATEPSTKPFRLLVINQKLYNLPLFALHGQASAPFDSPAWLKANTYIPCYLRTSQQHQKTAKEVV